MSRLKLTPGTAIESQAKGHPVEGTEEAGRASQVGDPAKNLNGTLSNPTGCSPLSHDAEWYEQNRLVLIDARDGAYRREGEALERMHLYDAYARVFAEMVLRAGVKPTTDDERAAIAWAEQNPNVQKPKPVQPELAA